MDHRQFIQSLSPDQRKHLTTKSNAHGATAFALHAVAIAISSTFIAAKVPLWPLLVVPQGILLMFLFTTLHECSHFTAFASKPANRLVARLAGLIIWVPDVWFRYFHLAHHRHTNDPDKDPELSAGKPSTLKDYLWYLSGLPTWCSSLKTLIKNATGRCTDEYVPVEMRGTVHREGVIYLVVYASLALISVVTGSTLLLTLWLIPILLGQPFLRLYLLAEHGLCERHKNMFINTRTTFTNAIVKRIAWNMPYHAEHHAYPAVPFYRLPELHELTKKHLQTTSPSYRHFHKTFANEGLKRNSDR